MIYLAGPFFNAEQLATVVFVEDCLRYAGITYYSPRTDGVLIKMPPEERARESKRIFDENINKMSEAVGMIALVDDKDTGTSFEMGFMFGSWCPIVTFSRKSNEANLMLAHATAGHLRGDGDMMDFAKAINGKPTKSAFWFKEFCDGYPFNKLTANT